MEGNIEKIYYWRQKDMRKIDTYWKVATKGLWHRRSGRESDHLLTHSTYNTFTQIDMPAWEQHHTPILMSCMIFILWPHSAVPHQYCNHWFIPMLFMISILHTERGRMSSSSRGHTKSCPLPHTRRLPPIHPHASKVPGLLDTAQLDGGDPPQMGWDTVSIGFHSPCQMWEYSTVQYNSSSSPSGAACVSKETEKGTSQE